MTIDTILTSLLNFGIGGIMAGVVAFFMRQLITVTMPDMMKSHAEDTKLAREVFTTSLKSQEDTFSEAMQRMEQRGDKMMDTVCSRIDKGMDAVCTRLENIDRRVETMDRHEVANREHLQVLRDSISKMTGRVESITPTPKPPESGPGSGIKLG